MGFAVDDLGLKVWGLSCVGQSPLWHKQIINYMHIYMVYTQTFIYTQTY